jgi:predicted HTH domain antitoxin
MSVNQLIIDLPESAHLPDGIENETVLLRNAIAVVLYKKGRLTLKEARELMELDRREFEECLKEYGFSMMDEDVFNLEINASHEIIA